MLGNLYTVIINFVQLLRIQDVFDILFVAYVVYKGLQIINQTRSEPIIKGIFVLLVLLQISDWLQLYTTNYILRNTVQIGVLALVVLFQPELRRGLEQVGSGNLGKMFINDTDEKYNQENVVLEITKASKFLSENRIGALIVIERQTKIGDIIRTGVTLNSSVTSELLINIFTPKTPLHDGATIIRNNQIMSAACLLPLTPNQNLGIELGTRHRAAIGLSETADSVVIVVSEETGKISIALAGSLTRNLTPETLQKSLRKILTTEFDNPVKHILVRGARKK